MKILERAGDHEFTFSYSQPADYHFCWDSIIFPRFIAERVRVSEQTKVLDLCAGCGVIGFELNHYLPALRHIDFVEIQESFKPHFEENCRITNRSYSFLQMNYSQLLTPEFKSRYDLIVCNPPYFHASDGKLSPSEIKTRARFFVDSDFETLIKAITHSLKPNGEAYVLAKAGGTHGRNSISEIQNLVSNSARAESVAAIRGTDVIQICKFT